MKKIFFKFTVVISLVASSMAFDVFPVNELNNYDYNNTINARGGYFKTNQFQKIGNLLIYPLFYTGNGWQSQIRVINTTQYAAVAKAVFLSAKDSKELKDFNIYLSGNDEWIGKVVEENGKYYIVSTDGSAPLRGTSENPYPMANEENPLKVEIPEGVGYVQIIGMACIGKNFKIGGIGKPLCESFDGEHSELRKIYSMLANKVRSVDHVINPGFTFSDGVILNKKAYEPFINLLNANGNEYEDNGNVYEFRSLNNILTGDVRITNTVNGTDMIYPAKAFTYDVYTLDTKGALIYVEGEKANAADVTLDYNLSGTGEIEYNYINLSFYGLYKPSPKSVYMTYGDTKDVSRNYLVLTTPFKRAIIQQALKSGNIYQYYDQDEKTVKDPFGNPLFYNVEGTQEGVISYGEVRLLAQIYNNDEMLMSAGQFSPATTPTIILKNEVSSTGTDINDASKLPYYLKQAQDAGYLKGYVVLRSIVYKDNVTYPAKIPGIVTQMIATDVGNAVVTNWFTPAQD